MDIVQEILARLEQTNTVKLLPWARAYKTAVDKPNVIVFTSGMTQDRIDLGFSFIGPVTTRTHGLFSLRERDIFLTNLTTVQDNNLIIGGMNKDWRTKFLLDRGISVSRVNTHILNLKKLIRHRIDLMISSDIELPSLTKSLGVSNDKFKMSYALKTAPSFIMISKGTPFKTVQAWQQAFESLKTTDFMTKTAQKWSAILGYPIIFDSDKGFIKDPSP